MKKIFVTFLFLSLFPIICRGQLNFDYKKDSIIEFFDIRKFKKYSKDGSYNFYRGDSVSVHQLTEQKEFVEWIGYKKSNIKKCIIFTKKGAIQRKLYYFQYFPIGNEYFFEKGRVTKIINHDENYKISIENVRKIILQTFDVDIFFYRRTPYYMEVTRGKREVYPSDWRYIYIVKFVAMSEEELASKTYYIDANTGYFLYKDEYGTKEDFFQRAKDLPTEKKYIPLRVYSEFKAL